MSVNRIISGVVSKAKNIYVKELCFESRYSFPTIGEGGKLYIATDENAIYYFDTTQNSYFCIGREFNGTTSIQCKLKED